MILPRVLTAIVTPFNEDFTLDLNSMEELVRYQLTYDTGVVLFGTTGECPTIDDKERGEIMKMIVNKFNNTLNNFVVGVGGNNTKECINSIQTAIQYNFNTFMLTTPYYNKPTQHGLYEHFKFICNSFPDCKFILYNVPGRTSVNLLPNTVKDISIICPNVIAIKEASGDLGQMIMLRRIVPNILLYCGDDGLIIPAMSIGAYGIISVLSNSTPKSVVLIVNLCVKNDYHGAFILYSELDDLIKLLFSETNPTPIKYLLMNQGLISFDQVRLPLVKMQNYENQQKIRQQESRLTMFYNYNSIKY